MSVNLSCVLVSTMETRLSYLLLRQGFTVGAKLPGMAWSRPKCFARSLHSSPRYVACQMSFEDCTAPSGGRAHRQMHSGVHFKMFATAYKQSSNCRSHVLPSLTLSRLCSSTTTTTPPPPSQTETPPPDDDCPHEVIPLRFEQGLPQLTVPLPSRRELCRFTLRPVTHAVKDLVAQLQSEDRGIDRVLIRSTDGVRIASSASIESLLLCDFDLIINDLTYRVRVPAQYRATVEEVSDISDVRQLVSKLYAALSIDEHQVNKERQIVQEMEEIKSQLIPLEKHRAKITAAAERRTSILMYSGLAYMALQFGFLARLTWWEYSWDIMEPVTYFVTYGTGMMCYAYYVLTKQDFIYPEVRDRHFLLSFHRKARKSGMNVEVYNALKGRLHMLEGDLKRLRDPLSLNLPAEHLQKIVEEEASNIGLNKSQNAINQLKNMLGIKK